MNIEPPDAALILKGRRARTGDGCYGSGSCKSLQEAGAAAEGDRDATSAATDLDLLTSRLMEGFAPYSPPGKLKFSAVKRSVMPVLMLAGTLTSANGAKAVMTGYQYTATVPFSTIGESPTNATLSFPRFDASIIPPDRTSIVLKGYNYVLSPATLGGQVGVACVTFIPPGTCPVNGPFNVEATLTFGSMSGGTALSFSPITESIAGPAPSNASNNFSLGATVNGFLSSDVFFTSAQVPSFTQPPSAPLPSLSGYQTAWSLQTASNLPVPANVVGVWSAGTVSGSVGVRYIYEYAPVPGPLPLMGVGAAFSWSRRLRKRLKTTASPHQI